MSATIAAIANEIAKQFWDEGGVFAKGRLIVTSPTWSASGVSQLTERALTEKLTATQAAHANVMAMGAGPERELLHEGLGAAVKLLTQELDRRRDCYGFE